MLGAQGVGRGGRPADGVVTGAWAVAAGAGAGRHRGRGGHHRDEGALRFVTDCGPRGLQDADRVMMADTLTSWCDRPAWGGGAATCRQRRQHTGAEGRKD